MSSISSRASLKGIIEGCGLRLEESQYDALWAYHRLLREADAELNLTRIRNFENMVRKHYVDSLMVLKHVDLPSPLVDMGSGCGPAGGAIEDRAAGGAPDPRRAEGIAGRSSCGTSANGWASKGPRSTPARSARISDGRSRG